MPLTSYHFEYYRERHCSLAWQREKHTETRYFGAPGKAVFYVRPLMHLKGRKSERSRGCRVSKSTRGKDLPTLAIGLRCKSSYTNNRCVTKVRTFIKIVDINYHFLEKLKV